MTGKYLLFDEDLAFVLLLAEIIRDLPIGFSFLSSLFFYICNQI